MAYRELGMVEIREVLRRWLTGDGLRAIARGTGVDRKTIAKYVRAAAALGRPRITLRVAEPPPGELAEADFGRLGLWTEPATGQRRSVYGLLVTLGFSRYAFLWVCLRQDLPAVLDGLEAAWAFFGGVVRRLVVDNFKPAVTRAD